MNSYQDNKTQIKKEGNSIKDLRNSLQDNSFTDSLYPPEQWDMKWDTKEENLVPTEHQYLLDDLYWCDDYDNIFKSEYGGQLSERKQSEQVVRKKTTRTDCSEEDNQNRLSERRQLEQVVRKEITRNRLSERGQLEITISDIERKKRNKE